MVLGAGGSARAAVWALKSRGAGVEVAARRMAAARALASELDVRACAYPPSDGWDVLVNTTPLGMWPDVDESPLDRQALQRASGTIVYDLVYNPEETRLLRDAKDAGATTIGGLEMLVGQACRQFQWWTGRVAPREVMDEAARKFLREARG